jgi:hypothetical protein
MATNGDHEPRDVEPAKGGDRAHRFDRQAALALLRSWIVVARRWSDRTLPHVAAAARTALQELRKRPLKPLAASAISRAVSFLPSGGTASAPEPPRPDDPELIEILAGLDAMAPERRDDVGVMVLDLWEAFTKEFGGISAFVSQSAEARGAYVSRLQASAGRMAATRGTDREHFYYSVVTVAHYLDAWSQAATEDEHTRSPTQVDRLGAQFTALVERGRNVRAARAGPPGTPASARTS